MDDKRVKSIQSLYIYVKLLILMKLTSEYLPKVFKQVILNLIMLYSDFKTTYITTKQEMNKILNKIRRLFFRFPAIADVTL